ncbi:sugar-binding transcriptional regulator [Photobacterium galatheae]|uniref:DNA-binding protein n=1 Tax=Photobacterium galatheae TaxID=1654360 RepID=A0A066RNF1_9GAMM|nr:sugar-binding transcriptional regulator [Photobacterium galatheae]KDM91889.1 DNA-binding protein [Photobacterium galatheae]MCM0147698.1 sugar-binding transcriptional regulator [Photobacterium galatheae]
MNLNTTDAAQVDSDQLTEIAIAYYQDGATQEEISQRFGMSRAKVGRLLRRARDEGVVEITVKYHPVFSEKLEQQLIDRFQLKRALIALDQPDEEAQRQQVASLVSSYLAATLTDDMVVAVGQGRNIAAIASHVGVVPHRHCRFVCGIGGTHRSGNAINADHICRQLAKKYDGISETLYAPAYVADIRVKDAFMQNSTVKETLDRARRADLALVGVGDMNENSHMVKMGWFTPQEIVEARIRKGVVGDIAGYDFFDSQGKRSDTMMSDRVIGLSMEELRHIPTVVVTAAENSKALALLGALRSGVVDVLATSVSNALTILNLDQQIK